MRRFTGIFFVFFSLFPVFIQFLYAKSDEELLAQEKYARSQVIITYNNDAGYFDRARVEKNNSLKKIKKLRGRSSYLYEIKTGKDPKKYKKDLEKNKPKEIRSVDVNYFRQIFYSPYPAPDDPYYHDSDPYNMWNYNIAEADRALNETTGGMSSWAKGNTGTVIAILDTGMRVTHEELSGKTVPGHNFTGSGSDTDTTDSHFHGTAVASVAAAYTDNSLGMTGFAADTLLMPLKISTQGSISSFDSADAVIWAADNGAKVLNLSYGGYSQSSVEKAAVAYAVSKGCVVVAATGNDNSGLPTYPSSYPDVISVGASSRYDGKSDFSNYGSQVECVAPAGWSSPADRVVCASKDSDTGYGLATGTSFSSPEVAGLAAVLVSNGVEYYEAVSRIARTCDKTGAYPYASVSGKTLGAWNKYMGYGRINFYECMKTLVPPENFTITGLTGSVTMTWDPPPLYNTATAGYNVYRRTGASGGFVKINDGLVAGGAYTDIGVDNGQEYYYFVRAVDSNGFETRASSVDSGTVGGTVATKTFTETFTFTPTITNTYTVTPTYSATPAIQPTSGCVVLDTDFNGTGFVHWDFGADPSADGYIFDTAVDSSGRILATGWCRTVYGGSYYAVILRFNADGTLDTTFNGTGYVTYLGSSSETGGRAIAIDSGGKIVVGGNLGLYMYIWRFNEDGTPDTTFNGTGNVHSNNTLGTAVSDRVFDLKIDANGKIVATGDGWRSSPSAGYSMVVWRFNSDGTPDTSFNGTGHMSHYNAVEAGSDCWDTGFALDFDGSGRIIVTGESGNTSYPSWWDAAVWRVNSSGTLDTSFNAKGYLDIADSGDSEEGDDVIIDSSGKIVVTGGENLFRFNEDGSYDTSFNGTGKQVLSDIDTAVSGNCSSRQLLQDTSGNYMVAGNARHAAGYGMVIWKYDNSGMPDTEFNGSGFFYWTNTAAVQWDGGMSICLDADGRIITGGYSIKAANYAEITLWRVKDTCGPVPPTPVPTPGCVRPDPSLNGAGFVIGDYGLSDPGYAIGYKTVIDNQGRLVVAGARTMASGYRELIIARYDNYGNIDTTFNGTGYVTWQSAGTDTFARTAAIDSSGRIVAGGYSGDNMGIWRFNSDGSIDTTFNGTGYVLRTDTAGAGDGDEIRDLVIDANNKIVAVGASCRTGFYSNMTVWRYNENGTQDTAFNGTGYVTHYNVSGAGAISLDGGSAVAIDGSGRIVVSGQTGTNGGGQYDKALWRINNDGSFDTSFNGVGYTFFDLESDDSASDVIIDMEGKIVVAGACNANASNAELVIQRFNSDGYPDLTFNSMSYYRQENVIHGTGWVVGKSIVQDAAGKYIVAAENTYASGYMMSLWRFSNDGRPDTTFNGTGYYYSVGEAGGSSSVPVSLVLDDTERMVVTGMVYDPSNTKDMCVWRVVDECVLHMRTATPTRTPGLAEMFTITVTNTPYSGTVTYTPTRTTTPSRTATPNLSFSPTETPSATISPTDTLQLTFTPTQTPTDTRQLTMTVTPTISPTVTLQFTFTPTQTPTGTWQPSMTVTPTISPTATLQFTFTPTQTPTGTRQPSMTVTPTISPTVTLQFTFTPTATLTFTPTFSTTHTPAATFTVTLTLTPELTETETPQTQSVEILPYPNPVVPAAGSGINVKINAARHDIRKIDIKMYTPAFRLIREFVYLDDDARAAAGSGIIVVPYSQIKSLASGVYYIVVFAESESGEKARSNTESIMILK